MDEAATLSSVAEGEIAALELEGIQLTASEIVELNALGWAVEHPSLRRELSRGRPVPVGGVWLWPITMRGLSFLQHNGFPMDVVTPAMGFALCFGRSEGCEMDLDGHAAEKAVMGWFKSLRCTKAEFEEAVRQVDAQDAPPVLPPDPEGKPMTLGAFCMFLAAVCGGDADFWERRCSMSYCFQRLALREMQNNADKRPCSHDPRIVAERALGFAVQKIREKHEVIHGP